MRKLLLQCLFMALPFLACAQNVNTFQNFQKGVDRFNSFKINDKLNVIVTVSNNKSFDLVALDEQMHIVWQTNLQGYSLSAGKFKNEVIAVAATDYSNLKGESTNNTYKGYIIDPMTGKVTTEKIIYQDNDDYVEEPTFFYDDANASYFKLLVRRSGVVRRTMTWSSKQNTTTGITAIEFNERLEPVTTFTPDITSEYTLNMTCSKLGNLLVTGYDGNGTIDVAKYNFGDPKPISKMSQSIDLRKTDPKKFGGSMLITASKDDNNVMYVGIYGANSNKDDQLNIIKFDFTKQQPQVFTDIYDKHKLKALEKGYQVVNRECNELVMGKSDELSLRYLQERDNHLVLVLSRRIAVTGSGYTSYESTHIINVYDNQLHLKAQQLLPINYAYNGGFLPLGYSINNNKLYSIANFTNRFRLKGLYSTLNLNTGAWEKMEILSRDNIDSKSFIGSDDVLWFGSNYVIPYIQTKGLIGRSYNIDLQQNAM